MTDLRTAAQQAPEALEQDNPAGRAATITALRAALAQEQAEQVEQARLDAVVGGVGITLGGKRIDPASIYKQDEPVQEPEPGEYHGWVLREVLFDNGEPVGHREPVQAPVWEPVAMDWLHKWANQDDGAPETQWHEGYEAARRVVQIHLTAPPKFVPLTEEEIEACRQQGYAHNGLLAPFDFREAARAIEQALKEKNR